MFRSAAARRGSLRQTWHLPISSFPRSATKADLKAFIDLPKRLYAGHKGWVAPLNVERQEAFSPKKNPLFLHVEVQFFLARRAGRVVGRISAQVDRAYLERYADSTGHFGCLVAEDDPAIFAALFAAAEAWLKAKGMMRVTGPFSLSVNEEVGPAGRGLRQPPGADGALRSALCRGAGRSLRLRQGQGSLLLRLRRPERAGDHRRASCSTRAGLAGRVKVRTANMKMFDAEVRTLVGIFNDAWSDNWGYRALHPGRDRPCLQGASVR